MPATKKRPLQPADACLPKQVVDPQVSPDGQFVAYTVIRHDAAANERQMSVYVAPLDGRAPARRFTYGKHDHSPRWSPDGRELAFYSIRTGDREIYVMPSSGGPARRLTTSPGLDATPDWSPDGRWIVYRSERTGSSDVWVTSSNGRESRAIAADPAPEYAPAWSPDGRWIAFSSLRGGRPRLWRAPFPDGLPLPLTERSGYLLRWSRADGRIYYDGVDKEASDFWSIAPGDSSPRHVVHLEGHRGSPGTQSPALDSKYLYFTWREDPADVWIMDVR